MARLLIWLALAVTTAVLVLVLLAFGGDDDDGETPAGTRETTETTEDH
jgi:hypothetical protein